MRTEKLQPGSALPEITVTGLDDQPVEIGQPDTGHDWRVIVIYRGRHCPLCTKYLNSLEAYKDQLSATGADLVAVSADNKQQLQAQLEKLEVSFPLYYGLTIEQMQTLGLYISIPRSEQETDHHFAEPGLFVVNHDRHIQVVDLSNNPFVRPDLEKLVSGIAFVRNPENNYPIRGTYL